LWYVFGLFSGNIYQQLPFLLPFLVTGVILTWLGSANVQRQLKNWRRVLGQAIFITLTGYAVFIVMMLLLASTGTSYGAPPPVIIVFGTLYLISLGVGLCGAAILLQVGKVRQHPQALVKLYGLAHIGVIGLLGYAFYVEPLWLDVTEHTVQESKIPASSPPIKVALFSDIHMERWTRREHELLRQLERAQPDLIIISGDHINIDYYTDEAYAELGRFFRALKAPHGVYAVMGGVDPRAATLKAIEGSQVQLIDDAARTITVRGQEIRLIGIQSQYKGDEAQLEALAQDDDRLQWLIYHTPDLASTAKRSKVDLYLAGHTHGGQIALPFFGAIFTASSTGRDYAAGLYNLGGVAETRLYVTRGIGLEGANTPRARLFARPELTIINVVGTGE
jgi:uncharacterized protein